MGKHSYRLSAASVKNLRGVLLAALASALIFLFSGVVFQSSFYAVPLLALPLAIAATNAAWRAASACVAVLVFSLLEFTVNAGATPLSPIFAVYAACIFTTIALIGGGLYWRIRAERDSYSEQSARERSISALSTELLTAATAEELRAYAPEPVQRHGMFRSPFYPGWRRRRPPCRQLPRGPAPLPCG